MQFNCLHVDGRMCVCTYIFVYLYAWVYMCMYVSVCFATSVWWNKMNIYTGLLFSLLCTWCHCVWPALTTVIWRTRTLQLLDALSNLWPLLFLKLRLCGGMCMCLFLIRVVGCLPTQLACLPRPHAKLHPHQIPRQRYDDVISIFKMTAVASHNYFWFRFKTKSISISISIY